MTIIAAYKALNNVYVAYDTIYVLGHGYICYNKNNATEQKIVKTKNEIIGFSGDVSIRNYFEQFYRIHKKDSFSKPIQSKDQLYDLIKEFNVFYSSRDYEITEQKEVGIEMLVVTSNKKIFDVSDDGCIIEQDKFGAIGSGTHVANGLLEWFSCNQEVHNFSPEKILTDTLETVFKYKTDCGGQVVITKL